MANFLSPLFNEQTFTANGDPAVGYKINTYEAGTSTPIDTFTTKNGNTAQSNPIVLNARGAPDDVIWLAQGVSYKFVLTDANDVVIDTFDNISGINDTSVSSGEWTASGYTPTYIGATSFSVVGDRTGEFLVGRRVRSTNTGGTTYSLITASSYSSGTGLTTVTVSNDSGTLDAGLSSVDFSILTPDNPSLPNSQESRQALGLGYGADIASAATVDFTARTGNLVIVTGTTQITAATMSSGDDFYVIAAAALPVNISGVLSYTCVAGDMLHFTQDRLGVQRIRVLRANDTPQYGECRLAKDGSDLKLSPYKGNKITIGGRVETVPSAGVTLSASGLTPSTLYYIYAYMNSGTMTLEASATGHSVDSTTGVEIKTGDATRTLVGMARPDTGPAWVDSAAKRFVRSWFNSPAIGCSASFSAGRNTSSTSFTELNTEIRNEFLIWSGEVAQISTDGYQTSAAAGNAWTSIGIDSTSTAEDTVNGQSNPSSGLGSANCTLTKTGLSEGYHYATLLAKVASANATWNGGATAGDRCVVQTYLGPRS